MIGLLMNQRIVIIIKKIKCHIKKEVNPYPKFVKGIDHNGFRVVWTGKPTKKQLEEIENEIHTNDDWLCWQIKHGKDIHLDDLK